MNENIDKIQIDRSLCLAHNNQRSNRRNLFGASFDSLLDKQNNKLQDS